MTIKNILISIFILAISTSSVFAADVKTHYFVEGTGGGEVTYVDTGHRLSDTGQNTSYATNTGDDGDYQPSARQLSLTNNGNKTVTDNNTGLMWARRGNKKGCNNGQKIGWNAGVAYCQNLNFDGYKDWRMPNIRELLSIIDYGQGGHNKSINPSYFPNTKNHYYWSSTPYGKIGSQVWVIYFSPSSSPQYLPKGFGPYYIRCVRDTP